MSLAARLLLLVALLLPLRGMAAVAGGWCHTAGDERASAQQPHHHDGPQGHHDGVPAQAVAPDLHSHADGFGSDAADPSQPSGHDASSTCTFCSAVCAAVPLASRPAELHGLLPPGAERFPSLSVPRASAPFGAPERPPRGA